MYAFLNNCWTLAPTLVGDSDESQNTLSKKGQNDKLKFLLMCSYLFLFGKKCNLNKCLSNTWLSK